MRLKIPSVQLIAVLMLFNSEAPLNPSLVPGTHSMLVAALELPNPLGESQSPAVPGFALTKVTGINSPSEAIPIITNESTFFIILL